MITTPQEALDTILHLVEYGEDDHEMALAATATIWRLMEHGHGDLALQIVATYKTRPCIRCGDAVDAEIHKEELGFCVECQGLYFDHKLNPYTLEEEEGWD